MNQREVQAHRPRQRERLLVNALAAANLDFAGQFLRDDQRFRQRTGHPHAGLRQRLILRDNDRPSAVQGRAWPRLEAHPTQYADFSGGLVLKELKVLRNPPRQLPAAADDAVLGAGGDEMEELRHR